MRRTKEVRGALRIPFALQAEPRRNDMADFLGVRNIPENLLKALKVQYLRVWKAYSGLLLDDPAISTRIEALLRVSSYVVPGRFVASKELGELLYGLSNLLALLHDYIFRSRLKLPKYPGEENEKRVLLYLSVIESVEVFLEMTADKLWGEIGKWLVVVVIQLSKVALRMLLLYRDKAKLQKYPLVPLLNRQLVFQVAKKKGDRTCEGGQSESGYEEEVNLEEKGVSSQEQSMWKGKRSGRFVRSLASSPPSGFRSWKLPNFPSVNEIPSELTKKQFYAEVIYVLRPLLHLPSTFIFGEQSWKPWIFACLADVISLSLHTNCSRNLTSQEKTEISRRMLLMLFYLLRSPFYDRLTKYKILTVLNAIATNVPFLSVIVRPLLDYLPTWQRIYFYNWCS